ncbi:hypothetical protein SeSB_A0848 [Salmonella enterica subsp. enterica serovar Schwarzengrund str. SL480]|uniref:Uncharacterized protein n=1 Tax=Salmonella schwarzengrund (strain CVM19633) TaxID=439843 RepID=A0A0N1R0D6_SALSV|nr:hypothetical protein SeSA_A0660 [Salmonella enterica subsp. enterica serovar Schwarzengrund str. CVM19633]EDY29625.1 hypothetical protein SeSB_A0848 [Salmonella enterica subsp. enterica serovar Schwarzengrund str. SL480]
MFLAYLSPYGFIFVRFCMLQLRLFIHQNKRLKTWLHLLMNYLLDWL